MSPITMQFSEGDLVEHIGQTTGALGHGHRGVVCSAVRLQTLTEYENIKVDFGPSIGLWFVPPKCLRKIHALELLAEVAE